jgi:hypothetical protein
LYLHHPALKARLILQPLKDMVGRKTLAPDRAVVYSFQLGAKNSGNLSTKAVSLGLGNLAGEIHE